MSNCSLEKMTRPTTPKNSKKRVCPERAEIATRGTPQNLWVQVWQLAGDPSEPQASLRSPWVPVPMERRVKTFSHLSSRQKLPSELGGWFGVSYV